MRKASHKAEYSQLPNKLQWLKRPKISQNHHKKVRIPGKPRLCFNFENSSVVFIYIFVSITETFLQKNKKISPAIIF